MQREMKEREQSSEMLRMTQDFERLFRGSFERDREEEQADERAEHAYRLSREK